MKPGPQKRAEQFTVCEGERGHIMWRQLVPWRERHDWVWVGLCTCPVDTEGRE